jgi:hypothetical protein
MSIIRIRRNACRGYTPSISTSIIGIFIPDIANKDQPVLVPALEISAGELEHGLRRRRLDKRVNVFLGDVAAGFIADPRSGRSSVIVLFKKSGM